MLDEQKPDRVVVTTGPDRTHAEYIIRAMRAGCDVVTEKPMTMSAELAREILAARAETGASSRSPSTTATPRRAARCAG